MRLFVIAFIAFIALFAKDFKSEKVLNVTKNGIEISNENGLLVGQSGFLYKNFDNTHGSIVAVVSVLSSSKDKAVVKVLDSDFLKQDSLPTLKSSIESGDVLYFDVYSNRSLLIAPNQDSYISITKDAKDYTFIHPDLFSSYLTTNNKLSPTKSDFQNFCKENSIGTLFIAFDNIVNRLDCFSFSVLDKYEYEFKQDDFLSPFYSRVGELEVNWFVFGEKRVDNYSEFYKNLIR